MEHNSFPLAPMAGILDEIVDLWKEKATGFELLAEASKKLTDKLYERRDPRKKKSAQRQTGEQI